MGVGAGDGNRTRVASLEDWNSTIELHPQRNHGILAPGPPLSIHAATRTKRRKMRANIWIIFLTLFWLRFFIVGRADCAEHLRSDSQSWFIRLQALSNGMVNHLTDVPAAGGKRQMIHASHLLAKGPDVKVINCLPQLSLRGRTRSLSVLSSFVHAPNNLKFSRTFGNHAMAVGLMICANAVRASEIMRVKP
jgi:hypothetical protein